ncbi:hypothetical protein NLJ89_g6265 [Agrocybe chaxingu]|uniref:DUF427 domain-containing protein n=1 Tax=Agrocybe chaxingu TaxID=84603 RepID=A0A9W8MWK5_9AGAR|nr:hypothetical protein NLJ89_g6265 [Agrocybe chaxingu]
MAGFFPSLPHIEDCQKRIRAYVSGVAIAHRGVGLSTLYNIPLRADGIPDRYYPHYYFLREDLPVHWYLHLASSSDDDEVYHIGAGGMNDLLNSVKVHLTGPLKGLGAIRWNAMDAWFEEDEQIFIHPKDPYKRIDVLQSSRHVRIEVGGLEVADTRSPRLLFETSLPMRIYIPKTDCRMDLWEPSDLITGCPYKGEARYYNLVTSDGTRRDNLIWWYPNTTPECAAIRGYAAFFDEKVDVWIDGEKQQQPVTKWSSPSPPVSAPAEKMED